MKAIIKNDLSEMKEILIKQCSFVNALLKCKKNLTQKDIKLLKEASSKLLAISTTLDWR